MRRFALVLNKDTELGSASNLDYSIHNLKKIVMLLPSFKEAGPAIVASVIAQEIKKRGVDVAFVSLRMNDETTKSWLIEKDFELHEVGMKKIPFSRDQKNLEKIIDEINPDIVHAHGFWPIVMLSRVKSSSIHKVATIHEEPMNNLSYSYGVIMAKFMCIAQYKALKKYEKVIACSNSVKMAFIKDIAKKNESICSKLVTISNGIEDLSESFCSEINFCKTSKIRVFSSANLIKLKNIETAINAVHYANKLGADIIYDIFGTGEQEKSLREQIATLRIESLVHIKGYMPRKHLMIYLRDKVDLVVMPSFSEGLSLAALEALMFGKPLLCSDIPSFKDVVIDGYNGFLCDPKDYRSFGDKLYKLWKDRDLLAEMANNARNSFKWHFNSELMGKLYFDLYGRLMTNAYY